MKNFISVFYRYRPIRKLSLSGFIGIGRYEKKLIGHTLKQMLQFFLIKGWMTFFSKVFLGTYSNKNSMKNNWISSVSYWVCHVHHLTNHWKCQLAKKRTFDTTYLELLWTYWRFILYPWANQKSCLFWGPVVHRRNGLPNMGPLKRLEKNEPQEGQQALSMMCDLQLCPCRKS